MTVHHDNQTITAKSLIAELANSSERLDFYYESIKRDLEDIMMGKEQVGQTSLCLDELARELDDLVKDVRHMAHRLRQGDTQ